jgi:hypothetical protein
MFENKDVMKIAPIIVGVCNWSVLIGLVAAVEYGLPEGAVKNAVRGVVYASFLGSAVVGYLGRKKRAKAKLYNDRVCIHDPDSGRDIHYEFIARVNIPNVLVNPWAIFAPIMADVVRLSKATGSLSCTPKTTKWLASSDGVRWNLDKIGCNELITGAAAQHLHEAIENLNKGSLTQQQKDMKEGLMRMMENGLKIE